MRLTILLLLGGLLPLSPATGKHWPMSGRWTFPVGDARDAAEPGPDRHSGYTATRNVGGPSGHQGVDLSNREAGGLVRAAAHGVVVVAATRDNGNGYGLHVVIAHREPDGRLVYSVYAHLAPGSIRPRTGAVVYEGEPLGRVGMTGDASAPHLHFEVRLPRAAEERWENTEPVDPMGFVAARLPTLADSAWSAPYRQWAETAGLIAAPDLGAVLPRGEWWRMLGAALAPAPGAGPPWAEPAKWLEDSGVLPATHPLDPLESVTWAEVTHDLARARSRGLCLPPSPVTAEPRHRECRARLGVDSAADALTRLARRSSRPRPDEVCLALADLAGDRPRAVSHRADTTGTRRVLTAPKAP